MIEICPMSHFGLLNVHKPIGPTSREVVNRIERLVRPAKCGHAGTLDPLASGVVVVCIGRATRLIQYVQRLPKRYRATFLIGRSSPTDDIEQEPTLLRGAPQPAREAIEAALPRFVGDIEQRPPEFSAVKIGGKRAYELAREGKEVELASRTVTIHRLRIIQYAYPELQLDIECGSGTYVRSLGRDLAAVLGTGAVMSALERTAIGDFQVEEGIEFDTLGGDDVAQHLQAPLAAVAALPRISLSAETLIEVRHGRPIAISPDGADNVPSHATCSASVALTGSSRGSEWAATDPTGQLAAILFEKRPGELWPAINFGR